jgi:hypothetical protein
MGFKLNLYYWYLIYVYNYWELGLFPLMLLQSCSAGVVAPHGPHAVAGVAATPKVQRGHRARHSHPTFNNHLNSLVQACPYQVGGKPVV